jgi:hypothetical protein
MLCVMHGTACAEDGGIHIDFPDATGEVRIAVDGRLDQRKGSLLLRAADVVSAAGGRRITVDLREVNGFTEDGVAAATACRQRASVLPCGVSFVAGSAPSRRALLAILERG